MIKNIILLLVILSIPTSSYGMEYKPVDGTDIIGTKALSLRGLNGLILSH